MLHAAFFAVAIACPATEVSKPPATTAVPDASTAAAPPTATPTDEARKASGASADTAKEPQGSDAAKESANAGADEKPTGPRWTRPGWGFGGVPAIAYNPDAGFQFGVVGNIYDYDGKTAPYKNTVHLLILVSTKLVQHHALSLDSLNFLDLPIRLNAEVGYYENLSQNFCGIGPDVTCDPGAAKLEAAKEGVTDKTALDAFLRHYYSFPYIEPYAQANLRLRVNDATSPTKIEALIGWRGDDFIPGTIFDDNHDGKLDLFPYPGSLYAQQFPGGEAGFLSVFQAGFVFDHRDNEPSPRRGWYAEATLRGAHPWVGSTWTYAGADLNLRGYVPVIPGNDHLILAMRWILDGIVGTPPIAELSNTAGTTNYAGYGGSDLGRGIRGQRYLGNVKVLEQQELRWHFYEFDVVGQQFGLIANAFLDAGYVAPDFAHLDAPFVASARGLQPVLPLGYGGAFLISWNENFIVRLDVAVSPEENFAVSPYITLGQTF